MRHPDLRFLHERRYGPHVTASRSQVTSSSAPRKKIVRTIFNWMKMLPHHWQAHTRDYSYAASHVRVPLCRPCGVLSLFNRTVARASIRSVGLCGSGYTAMTAIPNVLFNRPQCAPFSGLFFPVLSMVGLVLSYQPSYIPNSYRRGQISCGATACISCAGNSLFFRPMCRP